MRQKRKEERLLQQQLLQQQQQQLVSDAHSIPRNNNTPSHQVRNYHGYKHTCIPSCLNLRSSLNSLFFLSLLEVHS